MESRSTPQPRAGLAGALDRFIGPGASPAEIALQFGVAAAAAVGAFLYAAWVGVPSWSWPHHAVAVLLGFDVMGGVVTNATASARRWYRREGRTARHHMTFVLAHGAHLVVVWLLFAGRDALWLAGAALYLIVAAASILATPRALQRAVALSAYTGALALCLYILPEPPGLEWFLPLFYLKLLVSYLPADPSA